MPKYLIERDLPGAGRLSGDELLAISQKSDDVLDSMAGRAKWLHTYVTEDKLFCVYIADDEGRWGGFPCHGVRRVATMIDPTTAEAN